MPWSIRDHSCYHRATILRWFKSSDWWWTWDPKEEIEVDIWPLPGTPEDLAKSSENFTGKFWGRFRVIRTNPPSGFPNPWRVHIIPQLAAKSSDYAHPFSNLWVWDSNKSEELELVNLFELFYLHEKHKAWCSQLDFPQIFFNIFESSRDLAQAWF